MIFLPLLVLLFNELLADVVMMFCCCITDEIWFMDAECDALKLDTGPGVDCDMTGRIPRPRLSRRTFSGRTNLPCLALQVKYLTPFTDPSFLPINYQQLFRGKKVKVIVYFWTKTVYMMLGPTSPI